MICARTERLAACGIRNHRHAFCVHTAQIIGGALALWILLLVRRYLGDIALGLAVAVASLGIAAARTLLPALPCERKSSANHGVPTSWMDVMTEHTEREQRVRERAYYLWEGAGKPGGRAMEFWEQAEREIAQEERDQGRTGGSEPVAGPYEEFR